MCNMVKRMNIFGWFQLVISIGMIYLSYLTFVFDQFGNEKFVDESSASIEPKPKKKNHSYEMQNMGDSSNATRSKDLIGHESFNNSKNQSSFVTPNSKKRSKNH